MKKINKEGIKYKSPSQNKKVEKSKYPPTDPYGAILKADPNENKCSICIYKKSSIDSRECVYCWTNNGPFDYYQNNI